MLKQLNYLIIEKFINYLLKKVMAKYILFGSYCENALEKRTPYRQSHLDGLAQLNPSGAVGSW